MLRITFLHLTLGISLLTAQQPAPNSQSGKLAFLVTDLVSSGLNAVPQEYRALLGASISPRFASVNSGVASALSNLPVPSPASGVRYDYDKQLGVYVPSQQSLGPILTERAETIGKGKFFAAVTFQRFQFDRLDDVDFRNSRVGFPVSIPVPSVGLIPGLLSANTVISLSISQTTAHFTYGLTHRIDVSYALPIVTSSMSVRSDGTLRELVRSQTLAPLGPIAGSSSSTGIGDGLLRIKGNVLNRSNAKLALITDFRIPTGDEFNYHGAGAFGVKPFIAASYTKGFISPHANFGYQWNGKSFLASPTARELRKLPAQAFFALGVEASLTARNSGSTDSQSAASPRFTVSLDFLDQIVINGERSFLRQETGADGSVYNSILFTSQTRQEANASAGFKARIGPGLAATCNLLFRLNKAGLRSRAVPLVGLSYVF